MNDYKVFRINDYDWYMARSVEEAVKQAMEDTGLPADEAADDPSELSDDDMQTLIFVGEERNPEPKPPADSLIDRGWSPLIEVRRTFAEELARRIAAGPTTGIFASTEF